MARREIVALRVMLGSQLSPTADNLKRCGMSDSAVARAAEAITVDALADDPYPLLHALRASAPVAFAPALHMWVVVSHDHVSSVLRDPDVFTTDSQASTIRETFGRQMLSVDGPDQKRFKQACLGPFTGRAAREHWAGRVNQLADELVSKIVGSSCGSGDCSTVDLVTELARPLSLETMGIVLGLPRKDLPWVHGHYENFARALANFEGVEALRVAGQTSAQELRVFLGDLLDGEDTEEGTLLSVLAETEARTDTARLVRAETLANLLIVLFGGIETTESMIGNALWSALSREEIWGRVGQASEQQGHEQVVADLIEESLRHEPAVQTCTRHATRDVELAGAQIAAGETVQCMIGGANRDPSVFAEPDRFDLDRAGKNRHLSFGLGSHFCLGAQLARVETRAAITALLAKQCNLGLVDPTRSSPHGHEFRKPRSLEVHVEAR